jgi:hypothetical protein
VLRARLRRLVEDWLPWYDHDAEAKRSARTEAIRLRSIAARREAERVIDGSERIRRAYKRYADGFDRH